MDCSLKQGGLVQMWMLLLRLRLMDILLNLLLPHIPIQRTMSFFERMGLGYCQREPGGLNRSSSVMFYSRQIWVCSCLQVDGNHQPHPSLVDPISMPQ